MKYRGWLGLWRRCARLWPAAVLVTAFALAVTAVPAVAVPARPGSASLPAGAPQVLRSAPLSRPAAKVPSGGGSGSAGLSGGVPKPVKEIVADRTATTSTWQNANGTLTVRRYLAPHFYKSASGGWLPVDPVLAATSGKPGWWHAEAGGAPASFGPAGAAGGAEQVNAGGAQVGFAPLGVADPSQVPAVSGDTATYTGLWPGASVSDQVTGSQVKEDITLDGPGAGASFSFRLAGATARAGGAGGLDLLAGGRRVATIPPLSVTTRDTVSRQLREPDGSVPATTVDATAAAGARLTVSGDVVRVSVSKSWLAGLPASAFPVVIDPSVSIADSATQLVSIKSNGDVLPGVMQVGQDNLGQQWNGAAFIPPPPLPPTVPGGQPWKLSTGEFSAVCTSTCSLTVAVYGTPAPASGYPTLIPFSDVPYGTVVRETPPGQTDSFAFAQGGTAMNTYLASRTGGWWFDVAPAGFISQGGYPLATFDPSQVYGIFSYVEQPAAAQIVSPAGNSVVATATPTVTASPVTDQTTGPGQTTSTPFYDFRVSSASDGRGTVVDSGWQTGTSWTVPPGSLHDGVTYYGTVLDAWASTAPWNPSYPDYVPPAVPNPPVAFTVRERLGSGGSSPTDTVGSPPQGTSTPSQGAPSPGAGTASETVNMVTGDLSVALGTPQMQALASPAGITLAYDSASSSVSKGGNYGLTGQYYSDDGSHTFNGALAGQRADPDIDAIWPLTGPPVGGLVTRAPFMTRWTGALTLPPGTWKLGGLTTGGMRVYLNGSSVYDDWAGTGPSYGATVAGGVQYQIEVDNWEPFTSGQPGVQLWAQDTAITDPSTPSAFVVPSSWLTPVATGAPPGWTLLANPATVQWTRADDQGSQVVLQATGGDTATFTQVTPGVYLAPPGDHDYLSVDGNKHLQLSTSDSHLYTFNADGTLASMTTIADDRHPASLQYTYSGTPALLRAITDPVSARAITLSYGGDAACPASGSPALAGNQPAPPGMLCQVSYWDGTSATFGYAGTTQLPQLASVTTPGGQVNSLAYDSDNRLADIRDGLANDYLASGGQAGTPAACPSGTSGLSVAPVDTQVCYDSSGRVASVTQPAPVPGALRPARTYVYFPATDGSGTTYLKIAGFSPSNHAPGNGSGYAERTDYDAQGRVIRETDSAGHATTTVWATATTPGRICSPACGGQDEPIVTADPAGEQTSTVYDTDGNVTDTYGPAPVACFSGGWPTGVTPTAPVTGYLPVANPQGTVGCGVSAVPHTHNGYDEGIAGLAATYWANGQFTGAPAMHATSLVGQPQPQSWCGTVAGLCAQWAVGSAPAGADANGNWSLRLTGNIIIPSNVGYTLSYQSEKAVNIFVANSEPITVSVDGSPVVHNGPDNNTTFKPGSPYDNWTDQALGLTPGPHSIEVDFQGTTAQLSEFSVQYNYQIDQWGDFSSYTLIPDSMLDPAYGLKTSTADPDGNTTTTSYSNSTIGPEYGLPTATTAGAGSSTPLTTTTTYEAPGAGSYLRKLSSTLPAGNATAYTYYAGTDGPAAAACGVSAGTPQGGQLEKQTDPDPGNGQRLVKQFIYDAAGRQVGVRTGVPGDIGAAAWQCTSYDSRGRLAQETWPAANGAPARTVTYTYAVGGNPQVSSVSDGPTDTITSTVDLLGRATSYTDAWGQTTSTTYNQAGQVTSTSGPGGSYQLGYDPNSGQPTTTTVNGTLLATAGYDTATGRMTGVTYGNGTAAVIGYDAYGSQDGRTYNAPGGALLDQDTVTRTLAGRESTETTSQAGGLLTVSYSYDGAGRLTQAADTSGGTQVSSYSYAASPSCPSPNAGENTNRTSVTIGTTTTSYCYNNADQLVSSTTSAGTSTSYAYNERGDQANDNGTAYTWDASDRVASATTCTSAPPGLLCATQTTLNNSYDAVDRLIQSTSTPSHPVGLSQTVRYSYAGYGDSPAAVLDTSGNILQQIVTLPGGVTVTLQSSGNTWSYTNLQGDVTATASNTGTLTAGPVTYDLWGNLNPGQTAPGNTTGPNTLGAYAAAGKLTNTAGTVLLGARTFNPTEARFLSVDPVQGGCANPYVYAAGDPLTQQDLTGLDYCFSIPASMALDIANGAVDAAEALEVSNIADVPGDLLSIALDLGAEHLAWAAETATDWARGQRIQAHTPGNYASGISRIGNAVPMVAIDIPTWGKIPDGIPKFIPWVKGGYGTKGVNPCASS